MNILKLLKTRLNAYSGLTTLVSTRIYHKVLPQEVTYPAVSYFVVSNNEDSAMGSDTGLQHARIQVSSWAEDNESVANVAEQVRDGLKRWSGTLSGVTVQDIFLENEFDMYSDQVKDWHIVQDYIIHYR